MDHPARVVEATQRWIPPQSTNSDTDTGGSNVGHYFASPKGPQTSSDVRKSSTSSHGQPPVPVRPPSTAMQSDWAKSQQLFAVKLREWQSQVAAAEEDVSRALEAAKSKEEIEQAMEKYHQRMRDLLRDRGGELDELEQSVSGSASSAHSEDDDEEPEGGDIVMTEEPVGLWEASGFDDMELGLNGQESSDPEVEIPDSNDSSDASDDDRQAPPPTENDEDYRAAQRRLNMQRLRGERALSHASARLSKLTPTAGTSTPTRSRPMNIATLFQQSPTNSKAPPFPSPSDSATPVRPTFPIPAMPRPTPAAALPRGNPSLSRAKSPRARSDTLTPDRLMSRPIDNSNWRQNYEESLKRTSQQEESHRRHMEIQREQQESILRDIEAKRARGGSIGQSSCPPVGVHPRSANVANHANHQGTPPDRHIAPTSPPSPQGPIRSRHSQTHLQPLGQSAPRAPIPSAGSSSRAIPMSAPATQDSFNGSRTDKEDTDDDSDADDTTESDRRPALRMKNSTTGIPIPNGKNQNQSPMERRSSNMAGAAIGTPTTPTTRSPYTPTLRPAASHASLASFNSMSSSTTASSARSSGAWSNTSTMSSTGTFIPANSEPPKSRRPSTTSHPITSGTTAGASGTTPLGRKPSMGPLSTTPPNPPHWHPTGMPHPMNASPQSAMSYAQTSGSLSRAATMPMPHQSPSIPIPLSSSPMSQRVPQRHPSVGGIFPGSSPSAPMSFSTSTGRDSSPLANMASSGANATTERSAWVSQPSPPIPSHTRPHGPVLHPPPPLNRQPSTTPTLPITTPRGTPNIKLASAQSSFPGSTSPQHGQAYARQAAATAKKAQRLAEKEKRKQARALAKEEARQKEEALLASEQRKAEQRALERRQREEKKRYDEAKLKETRDKEDVSRKTLGADEKKLKEQRKKLDNEDVRLRQEEERLKKAREAFEERQRQFKEREDALDKKRLEHDSLIDERKKLEGCIQEAEEKEDEYEREEEAEREQLEREKEQQQVLQDTSESSPENTDEEEDDLAFSPQYSPELESPNKGDAIHDGAAPRPTETVFPVEFFEAQNRREQELQDLLRSRARQEQLAADAARRRREASRIRYEQREAQEREEREARVREEREAKVREERKREEEWLKEQRARDEQRVKEGEAREARIRVEQRIREEQRIRDEQRAHDEQRAREERIRQENERLNQQFQAKERRDHAAKGHPKKISEAWEVYEENWRRLNSQANNSNFVLTFATMPWPVLNPPSEPDGITRKAISNFILSNYHSTTKTRKERLREALLKWHPDRFESRFLQKVPEGTDRDRVREGVGNVIRCLNELTAAEAP